MCGDVFANSSLKTLLCQQLEIRHPTQINKSVDFFKQKMIKLKKNDINKINILFLQ